MESIHENAVSFQTLGHCPAGFVEHSIKHENWYGNIEDSGWKLCVLPEKTVTPTIYQKEVHFSVKRMR